MVPALKDLLKRSKTLANMVHTLKKVRVIDNLPELDAFFVEHVKRHPIPDDKALLELSGICYRIREPRLPADPFSPGYRERILEIYREISGKPDYSFDYEAAQFDPETEKFNFFPYNSKSLNMVGTQLISQGLTLRNISLPPGGSIVELGAGQGNTALNLALTGYDVTVVEVNQPSIDLIAHRAKTHGREIRFACQDMTDFVCTTPHKFDAALFVASFHHCLDHLKLLENIGRIMKKGGSLYFADEPVFHSENMFLPYPWGLRMDGLSLFFIRRDGWLELGFQMNYMRQALEKFGWKMRTVRSTTAGYPNFHIATR